MMLMGFGPNTGDLYFVMDLSRSMQDNRMKLAELEIQLDQGRLLVIIGGEFN